MLLGCTRRVLKPPLSFQLSSVRGPPDMRSESEALWLSCGHPTKDLMRAAGAAKVKGMTSAERPPSGAGEGTGNFLTSHLRFAAWESGKVQRTKG